MIYMWKCTICDSHQEVQHSIADCNIPPTEGCPPWEEAHESVWQRVFEAPMQLKASYPDGHKRKGWDVLKESAKLEKIAAVSRPGTKSEIKREIRKMGIKPGQD